MEPAASGVRESLNLGCGNCVDPEAINLDIRHQPGVDVVHDLRVSPWPFNDNSFIEIRAIDVLEHLDDFIGFFDEAWRILKPSGTIRVQTPHYLSATAYLDPTHRRGYHLESFDYLDPTREWGSLYGKLYTDRYWEVLHAEHNCLSGNIEVRLRVRKGTGEEMKEAFRDIYQHGNWGELPMSGIGSNPRVLGEYLNLLQELLRCRQIRSVVDVGCGDWAFSRLLDWTGVNYLGLDVVPEMVSALQSRYASANVRFDVLNASLSDIPSADLWIVKDVLQHWPNEDVIRFLNQLPSCRYAILVNDIPGDDNVAAAERRSSNHCIPCGGLRPLELTKSPFNLQAERLLTIRITPVEQTNEVKEVLLWTAEAESKREKSETAPTTDLNERSSDDLITAFLNDHQRQHRYLTGRGIVIAGGGGKFAACTYVNVNVLRRLGCRLPIQVWHLGGLEQDQFLFNELTRLDVEIVDATSVNATPPKHGWELKPFAIYHSPFQEVLLLDADNMAVQDPAFLFETDEYRSTGALFWPDYWRTSAHSSFWRVMGISYRDEREFESGQVVVDKSRCEQALALTLWLCQRGPDFFWKHCHGDKECFRAAWHRTGLPFCMPSKDVASLSDRAMTQHDFEGNRLFQHRHMRKWSLGKNERIPDFWHEAECLDDITRLRRAVLIDRYQLSERDLDDANRLVGSDWQYIRCGYDSRRMSFGKNFEISEGSAGFEQVYFVKDGSLFIADGNLDVLVQIFLTSGFYAGRWRIFERMPIVLEPLGIGKEMLEIARQAVASTAMPIRSDAIVEMAAM